mmetsp:Transcript_8251/g.17827  ORF Transcript_8251/g.17827 Transcript_8251/m.17827 type:complete len:209 (-) Transcript_8251:955-1581(-)
MPCSLLQQLFLNDFQRLLERVEPVRPTVHVALDVGLPREEAGHPVKLLQPEPRRDQDLPPADVPTDVLHKLGMVPPNAAKVDLLRLAHNLLEQGVQRAQSHVQRRTVVLQRLPHAADLFAHALRSEIGNQRSSNSRSARLSASRARRSSSTRRSLASSARRASSLSSSCFLCSSKIFCRLTRSSARRLSLAMRSSSSCCCDCSALVCA